MPEILPEQLTGQGTRNSEVAPWLTYADEMTERLDPTLEAEIEEYSQRRHEHSSSQNEEELHKQRELNAGIAKEYQWLTPDEYEHIEPRIGTVMHSSDFINKLRDDCNVRCWYVQHTHHDKVTLKVMNELTGEPEVACWAQLGNMPEFSIMRFDDHGIPLDERRRGWRTCLLQLILKGIVTEGKAIDIFGQACGPAAERYLSTLYAFRNRDNDWVEE